MSRTLIEKETIFNFNEGEKEASIYTFNPALKRKLENLAQERPDECKPAGSWCPPDAVEYLIPKSWIKIRPTRIMTDEQKAEAAKILAKRLKRDN